MVVQMASSHMNLWRQPGSVIPNMEKGSSDRFCLPVKLLDCISMGESNARAVTTAIPLNNSGDRNGASCGSNWAMKIHSRPRLIDSWRPKFIRPITALDASKDRSWRVSSRGVGGPVAVAEKQGEAEVFALKKEARKRNGGTVLFLYLSSSWTV